FSYVLHDWLRCQFFDLLQESLHEHFDYSWMPPSDQIAIHIGVNKLVVIEDQGPPGVFHITHNVVRAGDFTACKRFRSCTEQPERMADGTDLQVAIVHRLHSSTQELYGRGPVGPTWLGMLLVAQTIHRIASDEDNGFIVSRLNIADFPGHSDFLVEIIPLEGEFVLAPYMRDVF